MMMKKSACILLLVIISCSVVYAADSDLAKEREIGRKAVEQIEQQWPLTSNPAVISKLQLVINKLEPYMERRIDWEVRLVDSDALNAFCLPGGYIFFTTGMINALDTDSELAAVMAHEMIHADKKHGLKMSAESQKITVGALAVMLLSGGSAAPIVLTQLAQIAITSAYTIELEKEADRLGMEALIKSGYSPTGMITLFERFMAEDYKQPIQEYGIYMNHPDTPDRLESAVKILHEKKIPIERKYPLGLLRTNIKTTPDSMELTVDNMQVVSGKKTPEVRDVLAKIRENLDKYLQLELAPYDIHVMNGALYIENHFIAGNVDGVTKPEDIRRNLQKAVNSARAKHPTSKFFK